GALSHYRFIGVIGVGFIALLALPQGRRMLADPLIGALSHYRFIGVIGVGFIALLALPQGRRMLADP
ncbi:hypothetical protein C7E12_23625, partial [Stenotrophomonas maltophilia]